MTQDPRQFLNEYYQVFSSLELSRIQSYFHTPGLVIGPAGPFPLDAGGLTAMLTRIIEDLRSKGYGRSEFVLQDEKALGSASAFISGIAVRFKTDGNELERVPLSYVLHKMDSGWKIAVMVVQVTK